MTQLLLCHGFSYSSDYWVNLIPHLPEFTIQHLTDSITPEIHEPVIGVGHSLGLIKLMQLKIPYQALIGLNAFVNFLGTDPQLKKRRSLELKVFENLVKTNSKLAINSFHNRCGVSLEQSYSRQDQLIAELDLFRTAFPVPDRLTIVGAQDDIVCPPEILYDNFSPEHIIMLESGGHGLGYKHAEEIASIIKRKNNVLDNYRCANRF